MEIAHFAVSIDYSQVTRAGYIAASCARLKCGLIVADAAFSVLFSLYFLCAGAIDKPPYATLCSKGNLAIEFIGIGEHGFYDNLA